MLEKEGRKKVSIPIPQRRTGIHRKYVSPYVFPRKKRKKDYFSFTLRKFDRCKGGKPEYKRKLNENPKEKGERGHEKASLKSFFPFQGRSVSKEETRGGKEIPTFFSFLGGLVEGSPFPGKSNKIFHSGRFRNGLGSFFLQKPYRGIPFLPHYKGFFPAK